MDLTGYQGNLIAEPVARLDVCQLQPGTEDAWDRFVMASPSGTLFHLSGWKTVVEKVLGRRTFCLTARDDTASGAYFQSVGCAVESSATVWSRLPWRSIEDLCE